MKDERRKRLAELADKVNEVIKEISLIDIEIDVEIADESEYNYQSPKYFALIAQNYALHSAISSLKESIRHIRKA